MQKKYELIKGSSKKVCGQRVYRIRALKDFGRVKKGYVGGFVHSEFNLSHFGTCWAWGDSVVTHNARLLDDAQIFGRTWMIEDAVVGDKASIKDGVVIRGSARIGGNAEISGIVLVTGRAFISDNAKVFGNVIVDGRTKLVNSVVIKNQYDFINILHHKYNMTITRDYIQVGCQTHTKEEWLDFNEDAIFKMDGSEAVLFYNTVLRPMLVSGIFDIGVNNE